MKGKIWCISTMLMLSVPIGATEMFKPVEVSNAELAQLRGRYVLPDRIISFGVVMTSTWEDASGQVIGASVGMSLSNSQAQPVLYATPIENIVENRSVSTGAGQVLGGSGLDSARGIVQSVRVAGDGNQGENGLDIVVTRGHGNEMPSGGASWSNGQSWSNDAGTVRLYSQNGGLAIAIEASNGQGAANQQLGAGGMAQRSAIGGNFNTVRNLASLDIRLRELPVCVDIRSSLDQLKSLTPTY
ncbi:hypothetical protein [Pseudomonas sp.]|jgi:hypothetical protein|uniref:hypothetical protein n=1 Tax=Pseudomonas sp. TaxID=306 RepID=UPI00272AF0C7|nr:hypothetical protein [Pseudomonas sp.]